METFDTLEKRIQDLEKLIEDNRRESHDRECQLTL